MNTTLYRLQRLIVAATITLVVRRRDHSDPQNISLVGVT